MQATTVAPSYQDRKAARKAEFLEKQGKPQPRCIFQVFAKARYAVCLPGRFDTAPIAFFDSRRDAEEFAGSSRAASALYHSITRDESMCQYPGWDAYVSFVVVRKEIR